MCLLLLNIYLDNVICLYLSVVIFINICNIPAIFDIHIPQHRSFDLCWFYFVRSEVTSHHIPQCWLTDSQVTFGESALFCLATIDTPDYKQVTVDLLGWGSDALMFICWPALPSCGRIVLVPHWFMPDY